MKNVCTLLVGLLAVNVVRAQWSGNAATNLPLADGTAAEVQPKIAPTSDGGFYVSWYHSNPLGSPPGGFDVVLQRLDSLGNEQWAHNGVTIADRGFSSTQDYDLAVDASDHALLTFRDDRGIGIQITATRVAPNGTQVWGASGVQLTSTTAFVAAPKIAATTTGDVIVAWTQDSDVKLRKLDVNGAPQWGADVTLTPGAGSYSASHLEGSTSGNVILAIVHQTGNFSSPKHLLAQKLDTTGAQQWGAGHVAVWDGGSLQFGNFPTFVTDGAGGAVFGWYSNSPSLQCYAQRVLANGSEAFPHNGTVGSTNATRDRVSPDVSFDAISGETYLFWNEQGAGTFGVYGQKYDAGGTRQWGNNGSILVPLSGTEIQQVRTVNVGSSAMLAWAQGGFGAQTLRTGRVDATGSFAVGPLDLSSTSAGKSRLRAATSVIGFAAYAWQDDRNDPDDDVYVENVNPDGSLGAGSATFCFGTDALCPCDGGSGDTGCDIAQGTGGVGLALVAQTTSPNGLTVSGSGFSTMGNPTAIVIRSPETEFPPVVFGDGLRCVSATSLVRLAATTATGGASSHSFGHGAVAGSGMFHYQIWSRNNPSTFCDPFAAFNLSNGLSLNWP